MRRGTQDVSPAWAQYGLALLTVTAATVVRLGMDPWIGPDAVPYVTFNAAVAVTAFLWGRSPGLLATATGALAADFFIIPPRHAWLFLSQVEILPLLLFVATGVLVSALAGRLHTARRLAERSQEELAQLNATLEERVIARTAELEHRSEQLRSAAAELIRIQVQERQRLAAILHDDLQQLLAAARLGLTATRQLIPTTDAQHQLDQTAALLTECLEICRDLTLDLSPPVLKQGTMKEAVYWLAQWVQTKHGLRVDVSVDEQANPPSVETRTVLFQAARELLFNIVKHARVDHAQLELRHTPGHEVQLVITDHGRGFDASQPLRGTKDSTGFGLLTIRERLSWLGGRFDLQSHPGDGTTATLTVPA